MNISKHSPDTSETRKISPWTNYLTLRHTDDSNHLYINGISSLSLSHCRNEGDLSSRYYDPELRQAHRRSSHGNKHPDNSKSDPKSIGVYPHSSKIVGPTLPTAEDIQLQREQRAEDAEKDTEYHHLQRKRERKLEKERLEELVPRAEPGTRDRQLEKRKEVSAAHRAFRDKSPEVTVSDATLMGGDDIKAEFLKEKQRERERELRREEAQRAKDAERLMRRSDLEKKEAGTMEMLKKLAQERWGNTNA